MSEPSSFKRQGSSPFNDTIGPLQTVAAGDGGWLATAVGRRWRLAGGEWLAVAGQQCGRPAVVVAGGQRQDSGGGWVLVAEGRWLASGGGWLDMEIWIWRYGYGYGNMAVLICCYCINFSDHLI